MTPVSEFEAIEQLDSLRSTTNLPLKTCLFPMGYPTRIGTNSHHVLETVSRLWSVYPQLFDRPPVRFDIVVAPGSTPKAAPRHKDHEHLVSIAASHDSFAIADLRMGFAYASIPDSLTPEKLHYDYLEPIVYLLVAAQQFAFVHASCISWRGQAVLLCGDSGAGKTCLAFACAKKGWTFITGDAAGVVRDDPECRVIGRPYEIRFRQSARDLFPELHDLTPAVRPNGKIDFEASSQELGLASAPEGRVSHVVFLERHHRTTVCIEPYAKAEALQRIEPAICFGDQANRQEQRQTLAKLLQLPVLRLRYSDLDAAEEALRSVLERG